MGVVDISTLPSFGRSCLLYSALSLCRLTVTILLPRRFYFPSPIVNLNTKFTTTAANSEIVNIVGPSRSSKPPWPLSRILLARQWNVNRAYIIAIMATRVNRPAEILPILSPKLSRPMARPPRMTVKLSHERKVRSLAKKTLGSTRVGRAMRLPVCSIRPPIQGCRGSYGPNEPGAVWRRGCVDMTMLRPAPLVEKPERLRCVTGRV